MLLILPWLLTVPVHGNYVWVKLGKDWLWQKKLLEII